MGRCDPTRRRTKGCQRRKSQPGGGGGGRGGGGNNFVKIVLNPYCQAPGIVRLFGTLHDLCIIMTFQQCAKLKFPWVFPRSRFKTSHRSMYGRVREESLSCVLKIKGPHKKGTMLPSSRSGKKRARSTPWLL